MNLNCTEGPATQPCTALWSQGVYRSRSVAHSSTTATAPNPAKVSDRVQQTKIPTYQHTNIPTYPVINPSSLLTGELAQRICEMHVGTSVTYTQRRLRQAAQPTHNSPLTLTLTHWPHGACTLGHAPTHPTPREATRHQNATPPNCARGVAPNRLDVAQPIPNQP